MGLAKLAAQIGRSKGHLSKVEREIDHREVTPALIRDYQRALGVVVSATPGVSLASPLPLASGVGTVSDSANHQKAEGPDTLPSGPIMDQPHPALLHTKSAPSPDTDDVVQRRKLLAGATSIAALALAGPQAAWLSSGGRIGEQDVRRLAERTARQRRLDDYLGGADTYQVYASELQLSIRMHRESTYTDSVGRALLALIAEQAQQAGWAAFDAGQHEEAERLYRFSLSAAEQGHDSSLAGNAFAYLAYQKTTTAQSGVLIATRSCETVDPAAPGAVRALMFERLAWAHAVTRNSKETEDALARAQAALADGGGEPAPNWAQWVDHQEVEIMTGRCWTELSRPLRAVPVLERVLKTYDDSHARDKALYLTWLATAYIDANEIEQAAMTTRRAVNLSLGVGSVRPQRRIAELLTRFAPHHRLPEVSDLFALVRG